MTDNEIIKDMQCVIGNDANCSECRYQKSLPFPSCRRMCAKNALDLINRQKAEIERLQKEKDSKLVMCISNDIRNAKSEAIKDFAKRLKEKQENEGYIGSYGIDNLVKEMTEVQK
jgi:hypothetical protein